MVNKYINNEDFLYLGKEKVSNGVFKIDIGNGNLYKHFVIIGQSGSGKSFMLGRMIEEIIINTRCKIVLLDYNADFCKFNKINFKIWNEEDKSKNLLDCYQYDNKNSFEKKWKKLSEDLSFYSPSEINIPCHSNLLISFSNISIQGLRELLSLKPIRHPECIWLINRLSEVGSRENWTMKEWLEISKSLVKWSRKYIREEDEKSFGYLPNYISITTNIIAAQRLSNALKEAFKFDIWNEGPNSSNFEQRFKAMNEVSKFSCINLALFKEKLPRLVITRYILEKLWKITRSEREKLMSTDSKTDNRYPLFIVVDEAHNLVPQKPKNVAEEGVLELFRKIAAEGRKEGLFLILTTQRPQKLNKDVLSECDNICIMKLVSKDDLSQINKQFGATSSYREQIKSFAPGEGLIAGYWVNGEEKIVSFAPRRTEEGGASLPPDNIKMK